MSIPERALDGFLLAATIARDRGATRAEAGICPQTRSNWLRRVRAFIKLSPELRRAQLATISRPPPLAPDPEILQNGRAMCLLASRARPQDGKTWLRRGPLPRTGFVAEAGLLQTLERIARMSVGKPNDNGDGDRTLDGQNHQG